MLDTEKISSSEAQTFAAHSDPALKSESNRLRRLKIICWTIIIVAGLVQAWFVRHQIFSDGISYLEIAHYYLAGNWKAALNSYWSPLYSWILAFGLFVLRPSSYWEASLLHITNFGAYIACLAGFEQFLTGLLRIQNRLTEGRGLSEQTLRISGYCLFLIGTLSAIHIGHVSPDMVGTAIGLFLVATLLKIESGDTNISTYIRFGLLLGLEYLARAAFALFVPFYLVTAAIALYGRTRRLATLKPILVSAAASIMIALPFVAAMSISKGRFTLGDAGRLNYGWEVAGAARSIHWQGEPGDIGKPIHPTHKVFDHPAVYTFASPVPGTYPPWYEPSYWYAGISPHVKLGQQLYVLKRGLKGAVYLFVRSPVTVPAFLLLLFVGWRRWLSEKGILAYWFLWLPSVAYIAVYAVVYLDPRYVAGSFLVIWMCLLASIPLNEVPLRKWANRTFQLLSLLVAAVFLASRLLSPALHTLNDLFYLRESEPNLNGMIAQRMKEAGLRPGDRIGYIGESINADWARLDGAKIVAEVPVRYDREEDLLFRWVLTTRGEVKAFWHAPPRVKAQVFDIFRKEGVKFVMVDKIPEGADGVAGWQRVLPEGTLHQPSSGGQVDSFKGIAYRRLPSR
jgi:hypothetical protein